eukprot:gene10981-11968_t
MHVLWLLVIFLLISSFGISLKPKLLSLSYNVDEDFVYYSLGSIVTCKTVIVINSLKAGGGSKYVKDLIKLLPEIEFIELSTKNEIDHYNFASASMILVNHITNTDISVTDLIQLKKKTNLTMVLIVHDFFWIALTNPRMHIERGTWLHDNETHGGYITRSEAHPEICQFMTSMDYIIHQSHFSKIHHDRYCHFSSQRTKIVVVQPGDQIVKRESVFFRSVTDNKIKLGFLTRFCEYKGKEIIKILQHLYPKYRHYDIVWRISGVNIPNYAESIHHFINLVYRLGIHGLISLNKYGETYSFAITKYLNSQLPILYNNYGSFRERLHYHQTLPVPHNQNNPDNTISSLSFNQPIYSGIYEFFQNESQYINFIQTYSKGYDYYSNDEIFQSACQLYEQFLDQIIDIGSKMNEQESQQIYQEKIKQLKIPNKIYLNSFYKELLLPYYSNKKNVFIITSKINITLSSSLSSSKSASEIQYLDDDVHYRSNLSLDELFQKTLQTISSIRRFAGHCYIILVDNSILHPAMELTLRKNVDVFINSPNNDVLQYYTEESNHHGFAEVAQLIDAYNRFLRIMKVQSFQNVFKISGKYSLTSNFNSSFFDGIPGMIFQRDLRMNESISSSSSSSSSPSSKRYYDTNFYKIEPSYFHEYFHLLKKLFLEKKYFIDKGFIHLQEILPKALNYNFTESSLGGMFVE